MVWSREEIAERAALELVNGQYVNLGIGIPTLIAEYIRDRPIMLHSENGILGVGGFPQEAHEDPDIINAGKETVTTVDGSCFFDSATSFGMIRGRHIDVAVLGAMQVSASGDIANWSDGAQIVKGIGGAMDLACGARKVIVVMTHRTRSGQMKLVKKCSLPITACQVVSTVITDIGVFDISDEHFVAREIAPGVSIEADDELRALV